MFREVAGFGCAIGESLVLLTRFIRYGSCCEGSFSYRVLPRNAYWFPVHGAWASMCGVLL